MSYLASGQAHTMSREHSSKALFLWLISTLAIFSDPKVLLSYAPHRPRSLARLARRFDSISQFLPPPPRSGPWSTLRPYGGSSCPKGALAWFAWGWSPLKQAACSGHCLPLSLKKSSLQWGGNCRDISSRVFWANQSGPSARVYGAYSPARFRHKQEHNGKDFEPRFG